MVTKRIPIYSLYFIGANFDIWGQLHWLVQWWRHVLDMFSPYSIFVTVESTGPVM